MSHVVDRENRPFRGFIHGTYSIPWIVVSYSSQIVSALITAAKVGQGFPFKNVLEYFNIANLNGELRITNIQINGPIVIMAGTFSGIRFYLANGSPFGPSQSQTVVSPPECLNVILGQRMDDLIKENAVKELVLAIKHSINET